MTGEVIALSPRTQPQNAVASSIAGGYQLRAPAQPQGPQGREQPSLVLLQELKSLSRLLEEDYLTMLPTLQHYQTLFNISCFIM
jgi:hypothetical protein